MKNKNQCICWPFFLLFSLPPNLSLPPIPTDSPLLPCLPSFPPHGSLAFHLHIHGCVAPRPASPWRPPSPPTACSAPPGRRSHPQGASELQGGAPPTQTRVPLVDNHWQVCNLMTDVNMIATTQKRCCLLFGWWKIACEQPLHRPDLRILCPGKYSAFDALQINCLLNSEYFVIKSNSLPMPNPL